MDIKELEHKIETDLGIDFDLTENKDYIKVWKIVVPKKLRNKGLGTKAMKELISYANSISKVIILSPASDFGGSKSRLLQFYKGLGFIENKGRNKNYTYGETMYKLPELNEDTKDLRLEPITKVQLSIIEKALDKLFKDVGVNIEFTKHFHDRLNDLRNIEQISVQELTKIYKEVHDKYGEELGHATKGELVDEIIKSIKSMVNIPIALTYNRKTDMVDVTAKTIMRKKNFKSNDPVLQVENRLMSFVEFLNK